MTIRYKSETNGNLRIGTTGSAGIDLFCSEDALVMPFSLKTVNLGVAFELEEGTYGFLTGRSSTRTKRGLDVVNGIIDSDYRGNIKAVFCNNTLIPRRIKKGDRLVQMIVSKHMPLSTDLFEKVDSLEKTERNEKGFGSTGGR